MLKKLQRGMLPILGLMMAQAGCASQEKTDRSIDPNEFVAQTIEKMDTATFGAGCFWCVEAIFQEVKGVQKVEAGYSGGWVDNPTYEQVAIKIQDM